MEPARPSRRGDYTVGLRGPQTGQEDAQNAETQRLSGRRAVFGQASGVGVRLLGASTGRIVAAFSTRD